MLASPSNRELGDEEQGWEEVDTVGLEEDLRWRNDLWQPHWFLHQRKNFAI